MICCDTFVYVCDICMCTYAGLLRCAVRVFSVTRRPPPTYSNETLASTTFLLLFDSCYPLPDAHLASHLQPPSPAALEQIKQHTLRDACAVAGLGQAFRPQAVTARRPSWAGHTVPEAVVLHAACQPRHTRGAVGGQLEVLVDARRDAGAAEEAAKDAAMDG